MIARTFLKIESQCNKIDYFKIMHLFYIEDFDVGSWLPLRYHTLSSFS